MSSFKNSFNIVSDEQALFEFRRRYAVCISSHVIGSSTSQKVLSFSVRIIKIKYEIVNFGTFKRGFRATERTKVPIEIINWDILPCFSLPFTFESFPKFSRLFFRISFVF